MGKIENDELRKIRNEHFIKAFEHVKRSLNMSQGALAEAIGSKNAYISNFRNGTRPVPDDTVEALVRISATKPGLQLFSEYLYGNSDIMLLANVTDEEMAAAKMRRDNPDWDAMQARRKKLEKEIEQQITEIHPSYHTDPSSQVNAIIAAKDDAIESLKRELSTKDDLIQSLRDQLAAKDQLIAEQKARLIDYRRIIDSQNDLSDYHFPIGTAEAKLPKNHPNVSPK